MTGGCYARRAAPTFGALGAAGAALAACASPGTPPGGPERTTAPRLVSVSPDTNAVGVRPRAVVFTFDAVISETPRGGGAASSGSGASGLETVTLVSPRSGSVSVDWGRERVAVRPRRGFRQGVTYTVTLGPGVQDLRNNVRDTAAVAVFSTGGPIARQQLRGVVFDWANGRPAPRAVVEATGADSVTYVALADSTGRYVVPNVPAGRYLVRGTVDLNTNRAADPREAFDTVRATAAAPPPAGAPLPADTALGVAVYAFPRDTLPARLTGVALVDSATLRLTFDRPLRPDQAFAPLVRVLGPDSAAAAVRSVLSAAAADSAAAAAGRAPAGAPGDSARPPGVDAAGAPAPASQEPARAAGVQGAPFDPARQARSRAARGPAVPAAAPPRLGRPVPPTDLVVRLAAPLRANTTYRVQVLNARSLNNVLGTSDRTVTVPRAAAAPRGANPTPTPATPPSVTPAPAAPARPASPATPPARRP